MSDQPLLPFEPVYTIKDAAKICGLPYWLLLRGINNGDIPAFRFGNARRRVRLSDIQVILDANRTGGMQ